MQTPHSSLERLAAVAGPVLAAAGVVTRPYVANFLDRAAIADLATAGSTRWVAATALLASGVALSAMALGLITKANVSRTGQRSGQWVMPAAVLGAGAMAYQFGASGIGVYGTATSGGDVARFLAYAAGWETPAYMTAVVILGFAMISGAWAATATGLVTGRRAMAAKIAAVVAAGGFLVPSSAGEYASVIALAVLLHILATADDRVPAPAAQ
jgi:hypothetical protein